MLKTKVVIVGGGLSGIACARKLQERNIDFFLLEASDHLCGRVRTEKTDGFIFDYGFQVFNSAYKKTNELLKDTGIEFNSFRSGALIKTDKGLYPLCDPLREPKFLLKTLISPVGSFADRLRMLALRFDTLRSSLTLDNSIEAELVKRGFTASMIEQFFRPFLGGVFLEKELKTCCEAFQSVFRFFSTGLAQLPTGGMGEIPLRMSRKLVAERVLLNHRVVSVSKNLVQLEDGEKISADQIVLALDGNSLRKLLPELPLPNSNSVSNFYFESDHIPEIARFLVLNGKQTGIINNLVSVSSVSASYAPSDRELISVSVIGVSQDSNLVESELEDWFPNRKFKFLKNFVIKEALPQQLTAKKIKFPELDFYICGDFLGNASIESAVESGLTVSEKIFNSASNT